MIHPEETKSGLASLPPDLIPDWKQVRRALLHHQEPDWVPFMEVGLAPVHKQQVLGRPVRKLGDELEIAQRLGQPVVVVNIGLQAYDAVLNAMASTHVGIEEGQAVDSGLAHGYERRWAHGTDGVIQSEADFEAFPWPARDDFDFSILEQAEKLLPENFRVILTVGKLFNLGWWLMGFDAYAYALVDRPAFVERLHAKIAEIQGWVVERALSYPCVGMVWHADDIAYRTDLLVSPAVLRRHVFPVYQRLNAMCHQHDVLTLYHSDGNVEKVLDDIMAAGFDVFNPIEPLAMDIRALKRRVRGRLALIGNVDLSYTLTRGTPQEVETEVRALIRDVAPGGGYALASANSIPEYVPWRNFVAMHAAWLKYGRYPIDV